jgi:hypothetical protein
MKGAQYEQHNRAGQEKVTILYQRLSRDYPTTEGESGSIANQRDLLTEYANLQGWNVARCTAAGGGVPPAAGRGFAYS